jgi:hypothetical protein
MRVASQPNPPARAEDAMKTTARCVPRGVIHRPQFGFGRSGQRSWGRRSKVRGGFCPKRGAPTPPFLSKYLLSGQTPAATKRMRPPPSRDRRREHRWSAHPVFSALFGPCGWTIWICVRALSSSPPLSTGDAPSLHRTARSTQQEEDALAAARAIAAAAHISVPRSPRLRRSPRAAYSGAASRCAQRPKFRPPSRLPWRAT